MSGQEWEAEPGSWAGVLLFPKHAPFRTLLICLLLSVVTCKVKTMTLASSRCSKRLKGVHACQARQ